MRLLAQTLFRQRKPDEAVALFRRVVDARPGDAAALNGLGTSLASTGRLDEAILIFRRVLDANPQNVPAQQNLARALALRGR
jgi:Flp pilus assembly protein TadD